jgi:hypothetical protein
MAARPTPHRFWPVLIGGLCLLVAAEPAGAAPPGQASLIAPSGVVTGTSFTLTWQAGADATFYYLHLNDATAAPRFTLWFPAGKPARPARRRA